MDNRTPPPCIFPSFRYEHTAAMIDWLQKAFGFILHAKHMDGNRIAHAELELGSSIIMMGEVCDDDYGKIVGMPRANGGKSTYIAVNDADALYSRAKEAGAEILEELTDREYGSREFICRDPEGNVWCFGTYWPEVSMTHQAES